MYVQMDVQGAHMICRNTLHDLLEVVRRGN